MRIIDVQVIKIYQNNGKAEYQVYRQETTNNGIEDRHIASFSSKWGAKRLAKRIYRNCNKKSEVVFNYQKDIK